MAYLKFSSSMLLKYGHLNRLVFQYKASAAEAMILVDRTLMHNT